MSFPPLRRDITVGGRNIHSSAPLFITPRYQFTDAILRSAVARFCTCIYIPPSHPPMRYCYRTRKHITSRSTHFYNHIIYPYIPPLLPRTWLYCKNLIFTANFILLQYIWHFRNISHFRTAACLIALFDIGDRSHRLAHIKAITSCPR